MKKISYTLLPIFIAVYELGIYLSNDAYLPAMPKIAHDLHTSHHLVQLSLTTWFLGGCLMQLILGPVSDRYGRRPVVITGGIIFIASTLVCAFTHSISTMLIARFIQGASIPSLIVAGYATIHELFEQEKAIHAIALMNSITVLAPSLGPLFGAIVLYFFGWRAIFILLAIWAGLALFNLFRRMPETLKKENQQAIKLSNILQHYKNIICNKQFLKYSLILSLLFSGMIAWIAAGPFLVITHFHHSALEFGILQALVFGSFILGTRVVKPLMKRLDVQAIFNYSLIISTVAAIYALISALLLPHILSNLIIAMMLFSLASGILFPILNRLAIEASQQPMAMKVAVFSALMTSCGMLGTVYVSAFNVTSLFSLALFLVIVAGISALLKLKLKS